MHIYRLIAPAVSSLQVWAVEKICAFSDILRSLAENKGITQKKLAADIGVPVSTIGGYFQGTSEPDLEMIKRLANYFNCSVDLMAENRTACSQSFDEEMLLHIYRTLPDHLKPLFLEIGKTMSKAK